MDKVESKIAAHGWVRAHPRRLRPRMQAQECCDQQWVALPIQRTKRCAQCAQRASERAALVEALAILKIQWRGLTIALWSSAGPWSSSGRRVESSRAILINISAVLSLSCVAFTDSGGVNKSSSPRPSSALNVRSR